MINLMKYIEKIQKFMYGRYGPDELYHFLFKVYIILLIINLFIKNSILSIIELLLIVIVFYRFFSKKIYRRSNENRMFLKVKNKIVRPFKRLKKKIINRYEKITDKNYIYKKCNKCGTVLRLPIPDEYGIKKVKCPKCKKRLRVLCLKKAKVEVIKSSKKGRKK